MKPRAWTIRHPSILHSLATINIPILISLAAETSHHERGVYRLGRTSQLLLAPRIISTSPDPDLHVAVILDPTPHAYR